MLTILATRVAPKGGAHPRSKGCVWLLALGCATTFRTPCPTLSRPTLSQASHKHPTLTPLWQAHNHPICTLIVLAPKGPVEPLASRLPSGESARQAGHVVSSCRPCIVRRHTQCCMLQACAVNAHTACSGGEPGQAADCLACQAWNPQALTLTNEQCRNNRKWSTQHRFPPSFLSTRLLPFPLANPPGAPLAHIVLSAAQLQLPLPLWAHLPGWCCQPRRCTEWPRQAPPPAHARLRHAPSAHACSASQRCSTPVWSGRTSRSATGGHQG